MYAFDLLYLNGHDMRKAPLVTRKALLAALLKGSDILLSQSFEIDGGHMFQTASAMEGVVSKRKASRYQSSDERLGENDLPAAGDAADRRLCA